MPELPEVEMMKQRGEKSLQKKIKRVEVKDTAVLKNVPQTLRLHVQDHSFVRLKRIGKNIFVDIKGDQWLHLHFGMTGDLRFNANSNDQFKYSCVIFHFNDGSTLHYISKRKFGSITVIKNIETLVNEKELGPDAVKISKEKFRETVGNKRGMVKPALMDQKTVAGIGNIYADEILYQTKIHPKTKISDFSDVQLNDIYKNMKCIFRTSINNEADPDKMPNHYLRNHRSEDENCPACNGKIERIKVGGRGTYFCSNCQKT